MCLQRLPYMRLKNFLIIVRPDRLQMLLDLTVIPTNMLRVPSITPAIMIRERCLEPFKRHICTAHDRLTHVVKAVYHMPMMVLRQLGVARQPGVDLNYSIQAVQLVGHAGSEDRLVLVPNNRSW